MPLNGHCEFRAPSGQPTHEGYWFVKAFDPQGNPALVPVQVWNDPSHGWVALVPGDGRAHPLTKLDPSNWYGELHPHYISTFKG